MIRYFIAWCALVLIIFLPDIYATFFVADVATPYDWLQNQDGPMYLVLAVGAALFARSLLFKIGLLSTLLVLQMTELVHFTYFGVFYGQYSISYMFSEMGDFLSGIAALFGLIWPTLLVCLVSATVVIAGLIWEHKKVQHLRSNIPAVLICLFLVSPFVKGITSDKNFKATAQQISIRNAVMSWNYFFVMQLREREEKHYKPYAVKSVAPKVDNVVLIIGESANPYRMSIFGAQRENTPFLNTNIYSPDFHYQLALSASVGTQYSLGYFLNGVYEPDNANQMGSKEVNLFKLAGDNGFKMHYISNHPDEGALSHSYRYGHFETWIDQSMEGNTWGLYDAGMLDTYLENRAADQRTNQFLVLHMKNLHMDYKKQVPPEFIKYKETSSDFREQLRIDYDNAVSYFDYTLETWVNKLKTELDGSTIVIYVPDHSEKLGDNGTMGHDHLDIETATVPIFAFNLNDAEEAFTEFKSDLGCLTSHYKIHRAISINPALKNI